jgi:hypothetical protein
MTYLQLFTEDSLKPSLELVIPKTKRELMTRVTAAILLVSPKVSCNPNVSPAGVLKKQYRVTSTASDVEQRASACTTTRRRSRYDVG